MTNPLPFDVIAGEGDMYLAAEASTGSEAIEQFRHVRPDVTLLDIQMPDLFTGSVRLSISV